MRRLTVLLLAALTLGACAYLAGPNPYRPPAYYQPPPEDLAGVELGRFLFGRDCAFCHGNQGEGTARGPGLRHGQNGAALMDFMLRTGRMPIEHEREPSRHSDPVYDDEQIAALVEHVVTEFDPPGPEIPEVRPVTTAQIATGQQLYQQHCAACHATTGIGSALLTQRGQGSLGGTTGVVIPDVLGSSPVEIAEAVRTGPGTMPVFGPEILRDDELDPLIAYVEHLQTPSDPGGAGIGHIGPFAEGAVGWVVGLGALLAFIYVVGSRMGEEEP